MHDFDVTTSKLNGNKNFYQVCHFADPDIKKYHVRKFIINSDYVIKKVKNYTINKNTFKKLLETKKDHEYKIYSTYDLSNINYPDPSDILLRKSELLGTDSEYSGFAPFN
jgi:hypothetical protein